MTYRRLTVSLLCVCLAAVSSAQAQGLQSSAPPYIPGSIHGVPQPAIDGINQFSLDLYKHVVQPGQNLLLSPASVSAAMGLAYRGAVGRTADELDRTLHFEASPVNYLRTDEQLLAAMNFSDDGRELHAANAVWFQSGMPLKPDFQTDISRYAKAGFEPIDFQGDPEKARVTVNHWVQDATQNKIKELLHKGDVTKDTSLELVNAIYWKGKWEFPFDKDATKPEPFATANGREMATNLMHLGGEEFRVLERDGVKAILLPYQGGEVAMVVLLPKSPQDLEKFERKLSCPDLKRLLNDLKNAPSRPTILTLPKMHLDWRGHLEGVLAGMGATTAFGEKADFSGIATFPHPGGVSSETKIKISSVIHQTTIDVSEEATEAAAATAVGIVVSGRRIPPPPPPFVFRADHPFLFALVDERTGMILFMGRYVKPQPTGQ